MSLTSPAIPEHHFVLWKVQSMRFWHPVLVLQCTNRPVLGMRARSGHSVVMPFPSTSKEVLQSTISQQVQEGATICSDEHASHQGIEAKGFQHSSVNHSAGEYVGANDIHVNAAESIWALFCRSLMGVWHHHCSRKHLGRYLYQATFRLNEGNVKYHELDRLSALALKAFTSRITYRQLTHDACTAATA